MHRCCSTTTGGKGSILQPYVTNGATQTQEMTSEHKLLDWRKRTNDQRRSIEGIGPSDEALDQTEEVLTVASSGQERHPVDGDRSGPVLVVEMVDVVCGTEAGRNTCRSSLDGEDGQESVPEEESGAVTEAHAQTELWPEPPPPKDWAAFKESPHVD